MLVLAAATMLLVQGAPAPDLAIHPADPTVNGPRPELVERGPFAGGELAASAAGVLAGDAAVIAIAYGTFEMFTRGAVAPTATHFRNAAFVLGGAALILPPLGAALGARLARASPARGALWKAFLLSTLGHALALAVGYAFAPNYWAIVPVQLATMTTGSSLGLHWGHAPRARAAGDRVDGGSGGREDRPRATTVAWAPSLCLGG
jgi:hypothetical protein